MHLVFINKRIPLQKRVRDVHVQPSSSGPDGGSAEALQDPGVVRGSQRAVRASPFLLPPRCSLCPLRQHLQDRLVVPSVAPSLTHISGKYAAGCPLTDRVVAAGLKLAYCGQTIVVRIKILSRFLCLQNFHLIDYNMLVFTVIVLARRLIAAIVKEVRSVFNLLFSVENLLEILQNTKDLGVGSV